MDDWSFLLRFALVWALAVMLPGPNFLIALKSGLTGGKGHGVKTALGTATGSVLWASGTMLGLHALFQAFAWIYEALRIIGGLYLLYLGVVTLKAAVSGKGGVAGAIAGFMTGYRGGLLTNLSNPKTAAFFGSIFMTLLPPNLSAAQLTTVPVVVFVISWTWYSLVALGFSSDWVHRLYERLRRPLEATIGGLLLFFGGRLLLARD